MIDTIISDQSQILQKKKNHILLIGVVFAFLVALIPAVIITSLKINYYDKLLYSRFIYWADVLWLLFYAYKIEKQPLLIWKEKPFEIGSFIVSIFVLYLLSIACSIIASVPQFMGVHESNTAMKLVTATLRNHTSLLVFTALTAGVTEEVIFRGYLLPRFSLLLKNKYLAIIITSILFSILHYRYHSLREFILTFLTGIVFGIYYQKYRNIKTLITVHFLIDIIGLELAVHFIKT